MRPISASAGEYLKTWDGSVAAPRDAATVIVCREKGDGFEVLLLRRQRSMKFAAGMHVFPGGSVQEGDRGPVPWAGPDADFWAQRWRCDAELARALVVAAVRETFEESGILLASPPDGAVLGVCTGADWWAARRALESEEVTLGAFLAERGLVLRADLMGAWAHWVTPDFEPRRFSTRFFVAVLPEPDAEAAEPAHGIEADASFWIEPGAAVQLADGGGMDLMQPTRHNLLELQRVGCIGVEAVVTGLSQRRIPTISPRLIEIDGHQWLTSILDSEGQ